jgi:hypothetical protein
MSVIVATAYMDEAQRFDWLVAMDDGRVLATGTPPNCWRTGRDAGGGLHCAACPRSAARPCGRLIPPLEDSGEADIAIEARGLTMRFGDFVAVDHVEFPHPAGRDLRLPRLQRLRQIHHNEDAHRPAPATEGDAPGCSAGPLTRGHGDAPARGLYVAGLLALLAS